MLFFGTKIPTANLHAEIMLHTMSLNIPTLAYLLPLLRSRILAAWDKLDQRVIDTAVRQWRTRLRSSVRTKGGHSEHKLSQ